MKVSIKQISEITGFSPATVSNALNGKYGVNQKTADIIWKEADRLGYVVQSKITKIKFVTFRKNGKIIDDSLFFPAVIEGVEKQAKASGYETTFIRLNYKDQLFESQINEILSDGNSIIIMLATEMDQEDIMRFERVKTPFILLDGWSDSMMFDGVLINSTDSVCQAMEYLIENGHRKIGYIRGDFRIKAFQYREYGYKRVLAKYKLDMNEDFIATVGTKPETAYEGMKAYLDTHKELPTAFYADNDSIAIGAMKALQEKGYRIPEDISIIGFDDLPYSAISNPGLTTIHVYKHNMGEVAVRKVLESLEHDNEVKNKVEVSGKLIVRESVKNISRQDE